MRTLATADKNFSDDLAAFCRGSSVPREISDAVAGILADVRQRGDEAVAHYAAKFDGAKLRAREFRVKPADLAAAAKRLPPAERSSAGAMMSFRVKASQSERQVYRAGRGLRACPRRAAVGATAGMRLGHGRRINASLR